ncbi:hypothetical protein O6H91_07G044200 [Diphasiastrum complanatum]|uniref:Uncharacterized protein n=1 Tax=Diphasiastrum complanatum TaxID=34168 RepID=A0ACC2D4W2_DIPCM|nr:hypothetical protein O6H91_07G044200 [Diphasiastrum complanatum]
MWKIKFRLTAFPFRWLRQFKPLCSMLPSMSFKETFSDYSFSSGQLSERHQNSSDDESSPCWILRDIPEGHLAVYAGKEKQRFVMKMEQLNKRPFQILLDRVAQEFGYEHNGGLKIPCEAEFLEHLLLLLNNELDHPADLDMEEMLQRCSSLPLVV